MINIRMANRRDMGEVYKLLHEYVIYEHGLDKNVKIESLGDIKKEEGQHFRTGTLYFIVEGNQKIIGCLNANIDRRGKGKVGVIHNAIITKDARGKGYGDKLVKYVLNYLKKQGCSRARTFVHLKNKRSRDFWTKKGFKLDLGYSGSVKL